MQVCPLQHWRSRTAVFGFDERLQQVIEIPLNSLAQDESVIAGKSACVIA